MVSTGLDFLNRTLRRVAEFSDSEVEYNLAEDVIENCRSMMNGSDLQEALTMTAVDLDDLHRRESDVQRSLLERSLVRAMR